MDLEELARQLSIQDGTISRRQLVAVGAEQYDIERMLRRRDLTRVHLGVYVDHTGELSWVQRAWVALHHYWPAALSHQSALPTPDETAAIQVAVDVTRRVAPVAGVLVHRKRHFDTQVNWLKSPPRIRIEHAALDAAASAVNELAAVHVLAAACQSRETTGRKLGVALAARRRLPRAALLRCIVRDLELGACSVLEQRYLDKVERAHHLPVGERQVRGVTAGRTAWRDLVYAEFKTIVELDGKAFHDTARQRDSDFERDLEAAVEGGWLTVRLTYGQVLRTGCRTAERVGTLLQHRGWAGSLSKCADCH